MSIKKSMLSLSAVVCLCTPIYADYVYCKAFDKMKETFYYSSVFYASHSSVMSSWQYGSNEFADRYLTYGGDGANCYDYRSKSKARSSRSSDMSYERRWSRVVNTRWRP